jgi:hypothetical protein
VLRTSLRLAGERNPLRAPGGCADGCAMPWDRAQANELVARGDWAALLPLLRRDAVTEPDAALFLALILLGKQSSPVQTDPKAAALALCQCIRASFWPQRSAAGSRLATLRIARSALVLFSEVLGLEDVPPGAESSECVDTLNLVLRECGTTEELATAFRSTGGGACLGARYLSPGRCAAAPLATRQNAICAAQHLVARFCHALFALRPLSA